MSAELIAKLESASEGSRELDEQISDALCDSKFWTRINGLSDEQGGMWMYEFEGHAPSSALRVTTSIDAALALAERVLPEHWIGFQKNRGSPPTEAWSCWIAFGGDPESIEADCATPALAICVALLRASAAEGAGHE